MKTQTFLLSIITAGIIAVPTLAAQAQGCCSGMGSMSGGSSMSGGMNMSGMDMSQSQTTPVANKLPQPVGAVFDNYSHIQTTLANDSLDGMTENAQAIAKAVTGDTANTFPTTVTQQAETLGKATDLPAAREAFKTLSKTLIEYSAKNPQVAAVYRQVHCSMADADWLQTDSVVNNPYMGKAMARCGTFVKGSSEKSSQQSGSMPGMKM